MWEKVSLIIAVPTILGIQGWVMREVLNGVRHRVAFNTFKQHTETEIEQLRDAIHQLSSSMQLGFARMDNALADMRRQFTLNGYIRKLGDDDTARERDSPS